jgi:hypothetical protein
MTFLNHITLWISYSPIYFANGVLAVCYGLADQFPLLVSLSGACGILFLLDTEIQHRASYTPARAQGHAPASMPRTAQGLTIIVFTLWSIAQWNMAAPVPWIGAMMWLCGFIVVVAMPAQRFNLLWYSKAGIAIYALCVIGSRVYIQYTAEIELKQWQNALGYSTLPETLIQNTQNNTTSILVWLLWLVVPLGYFSMLIQQLFVNPMSLSHPFSSIQKMIYQMRERY